MYEVEMLVVAGTVLLAGFLVAFRFFEGRWLPPGLLFVFAFYGSTFLYAWFIWVDPKRWGFFIYENFALGLALAAGCFAGMLVGYCLWSLYAGRLVDRPVEWTPLMSAPTARVIGIAILGVAAFFLYYVWATGQSFRTPGNNIVTDATATWLYRGGFIAAHALLPLILLLFVGAQSLPGPERRRAIWVVAIGAAAVVVGSLLTLSRELAFLILVAITLVYHYRVRPLRAKHVAILGGLVIFVQFVHALRGLEDMIAGGLSPASVAEEAGGRVLNLLAPIQGWNIFTGVLSLVPDHDSYRYGGTYLQALSSLLRPRAFGLGSYDEVSLSRWYRESSPLVFPDEGTYPGDDFTLVAEAYVNFGPWMVLAFVPLGAAVAVLSRVVLSSRSSAAVYAAVIGLVLLSLNLRGDSVSLVKGVFYSIVPILLLVKLLNRVPLRSSGAPLEEKT